MQRDLAKMAKAHFDVLVIGGGITGACVAYDAAMRGLKVALVEKKDFSWATSAATSKLIHGGLRYLKNLEFGLVRESLRERRILSLIAPHQVLPKAFLVPTYRGTGNNFPMIAAGMLLYDLLSYDKADLPDPKRRLPHFKLFSKQGTLREEPNVDPQKLSGGALYYDCQMHYPERLTLEFVLGAAVHGAQAANYAEVVSLNLAHGTVTGAKVRDLTDGAEYDLTADLTVNVSGTWADHLSGMALGEAHKKKVLRSQGIHLIFRKVIDKYAVVLRTRGGRHFFLIPWRGLTLAGTTDSVYEGTPDEYVVTRAAAEDFLREINEVYPAAKVTMDDVTWTYGGLRPIVEDETDVELSSYDASRKYEIYDHAKDDKINGFVTVIGGKYTTSRHLAKQLVDLALSKLGKPATPCPTADKPLPGGNISYWDDFVAQGVATHPEAGEAMVERLSFDFGTRRDEVFALMGDAALAARLDEREPVPAAAAVVAVEQEMALTLEDVLWRRIGLGNTGLLSRTAVEKTAAIVGDKLGWDEARRAKEIDHALDLLARKNMAG
ncbi:MAG TPA: glycerol-3-phosphate dehydrogenase/oxidase [bacterium]|nr:glycerol-3-phosphate dehydrogenase/oxidase [bacterium]